MLNPVSGRCTLYFGDVLRQIQFQTELEGYFLDAGQEPPKRGIFRFPTEAARISNHNLKQGQGLPLSSGKFRGSTELPLSTRGQPKPSFLPSQKRGMGQGKGQQMSREKKAENLRLFLQQD